MYTQLSSLFIASLLMQAMVTFAGPCKPKSSRALSSPSTGIATSSADTTTVPLYSTQERTAFATTSAGLSKSSSSSSASLSLSLSAPSTSAEFSTSTESTVSEAPVTTFTTSSFEVLITTSSAEPSSSKASLITSSSEAFISTSTAETPITTSSSKVTSSENPITTSNAGPTSSDAPTTTTSGPPIDTRVPQNFVANGDFSNGFDRFSVSTSGGGAPQISADNGFVRFFNPYRPAGVFAPTLTVFQGLTDIDPAETYDASIRVRFDYPSYYCAVSVSIGSNRVISYSWGGGTSDWMTLTGTYTPAAGETSANIILRMTCANPGTIYADDLTFVGKKAAS